MVYFLSFIFGYLLINGIESLSNDVDVCSQNSGIIGQCSDKQTRWTFVQHFGCYHFQYSGCQGNMNNFETLDECLNACDSEHLRSKANDDPLKNPEIGGGAFVNNKDKFPWFAFIRISFPQYAWKIWNPTTNKESKKQHITNQQALVAGCSGIWISPKRVLTADHCLWWEKQLYHVLADKFDDADPNHDDIQKSLYIKYWRNVITDRTKPDSSRKTDVYRGGLQNVAIKLYGLSWQGQDAAHPLDKTPIGSAVTKPWWSVDTNLRAFQPVGYNTVFGGIKSERDVAVLDLHSSVVNYFQPKISNKILDLDKAFGRLQWAQDGANEPLKNTVVYAQLGAGQDGGPDNNERQRLKRTNDLVVTSKKDCKDNVAFTWTWVDEWFTCYESKSQDGPRRGDSGGPGLTLVSASEHLTCGKNNLAPAYNSA